MLVGSKSASNPRTLTFHQIRGTFPSPSSHPSSDTESKVSAILFTLRVTPPHCAYNQIQALVSVFMRCSYAVFSPRILLAKDKSRGMMVTLLACTAQRLVSSKSDTKYASDAS
mmetsp:Transcript_6801/g.25399  ORF Transcript_6801/g.25399 Transcript_6801/m.25399 type:complete len:113 (-) Transcript_6801:350-688(-)